MNFNNSTFKNILNKFLEHFLVKKTYLKILDAKKEALLSLKQNDLKSINIKFFNKTFESLKTTSDLTKETRVDESILIVYVLDITVTRSNSYLNIFDSAGKLKLSVSAGNLLDISTRKRGTVRSFVLKSIFKLIAKQKYLIGKPIALHLKNKVLIHSKFLRKLQKKRFLKSITYFHKVPFNGCRKKKVRST